MTFDDMTADWFTRILGRGEVRACTWDRIGEGQGFSSKLARFTLEGRDVPATIVAKCPAKEEEVCAYREITAAPLAGCYASSPGEYLLLEDVEGRVGDAVHGCDAADAARVLEAMADFHAAHWNRAPDWPRKIGADPARAQLNHDERLPVFLERYGDRLPSGCRALLERLRPGYGERWGRLARAPLTLLHSDLHLDNVIFAPDRLVFLDWENPGVGRAAFDVAWFLYPALNDRREHEESLVRAYHERLGVDGYAYEELRADLDAALLILVGACVNGISRIDPATCHPRQMEWVDEFLAPGLVLQAALGK